MSKSPAHNKEGRDWQVFYRQEAQDYEATRYGARYGRVFQLLHHEIISEFLASSPPAKVLDVAAGTGHISGLLSSLGFHLTSLDLTEEMLSVARNKIGQRGQKVNFVRGDAFALPFADNAFNVVISTRFLHLWPEKKQCTLIREMVRVLRPGGILIVDFDNRLHRTALKIPIFIYQRVLGKGRIVEEYYNRVEQAAAMIRAEGVGSLAVRGVGGYFLALPLMISRRLALAAGRLIGRTSLYRLFAEQFIIRGQKL